MSSFRGNQLQECGVGHDATEEAGGRLKWVFMFDFEQNIGDFTQMRALLSFLICFVFLESQVFAIHGGVPYNSSTSFTGTVTGTYAGILVGPTNELGLFTMTAPSTGLATGTAFIYASGVSYTGTINGFANQNTGQIVGVIDTASTFKYVSGGTTYTLVAGGQIKASLSNASSGTGLPSLSGSAVITALDTTLTSTTQTYLVEGVKQQ